MTKEDGAFIRELLKEYHQWSENVWMEVMTVDLDSSWKEIYRRLIRVIDGMKV
jgi:hypothetical protein